MDAEKLSTPTRDMVSEWCFTAFDEIPEAIVKNSWMKDGFEFFERETTEEESDDDTGWNRLRDEESDDEEIDDDLMDLLYRYEDSEDSSCDDDDDESVSEDNISDI